MTLILVPDAARLISKQNGNAGKSINWQASHINRSQRQVSIYST